MKFSAYFREMNEPGLTGSNLSVVQSALGGAWAVDIKGHVSDGHGFRFYDIPSLS